MWNSCGGERKGSEIKHKIIQKSQLIWKCLSNNNKQLRNYEKIKPKHTLKESVCSHDVRQSLWGQNGTGPDCKARQGNLCVLILDLK